MIVRESSTPTAQAYVLRSLELSNSVLTGSCDVEVLQCPSSGLPVSEALAQDSLGLQGQREAFAQDYL